MCKRRTLQAVVNMDLATFCQPVILCGITQVLVCNLIIVVQAYNDMEVFACYTWQMIGSVTDFVKLVSKLPATQDGKQPLIPFASIQLLQAMSQWTIEGQQGGLSIVVHNELTHEELEWILECMEEEESITGMKPVPPPLYQTSLVPSGKNWRVFSEGFKGHCALV